MSETVKLSPRAASHACIIACSDEAAREKAALDLACAMVCEQGGETACGVCPQCRHTAAKINPDVIEITRKTDDKGKTKREISVDQIRAMSADAWVRPQKAERKVYIIKDAGCMNDAAQNAALKLLEEPPSYASFILCTDSAEGLLQTIRSRCVTIRPKGGEAKRAESALAKEYLAIAARGDRAGLCSFFGRNDALDAEALGELIAGVKAELCEVLSATGGKAPPLSRADAARLLSLCQRAEEYLRLNVGAKHIIGLLCVLTA